MLWKRKNCDPACASLPSISLTSYHHRHGKLGWWLEFRCPYGTTSRACAHPCSFGTWTWKGGDAIGAIDKTLVERETGARCITCPGSTAFVDSWSYQEAGILPLLSLIANSDKYRQTEAVQVLRGDPSTSDDEHLRITLVQLDIERVKFIVRSYVRTRLFKVRSFVFIFFVSDLWEIDREICTIYHIQCWSSDASYCIRTRSRQPTRRFKWQAF
jgi:hypothetical protein